MRENTCKRIVLTGSRKKNRIMDSEQVIRFEEIALQEDAERLFRRMNSTDARSSYQEKLKTRMTAVYEEIRGRIDPKAVFRFYDKEELALTGTRLTVHGVDLDCPAFSRLDPDQLLGLYVLFLTAGSVSMEKDAVFDLLIADMWGTAFADAARISLFGILRQDGALSEAFGPGFQGMDLKTMHALNQLVDPSSIGLCIKDSGMLDPVKSCGLLIFRVTEDYVPQSGSCQQCVGSVKNCVQCNLIRRQ